jgi:cytochrome P450
LLRGARNPLHVLETHWHRYGDVFRVRVFGQSTLIVSHPEAIKHILRTNRDNYVKGVAYDGLRRLMGGSLLTLEGEPWKQVSRCDTVAS